MRAYMIIDMQYGSTGKGLLAGYLAQKFMPDVVATAWGPNAGHTFIDRNGREYIHRMLANGVVSPKLKHVCIGPGSVIDPDILAREIVSCADLLQDVTIHVHPKAAIVTEKHLDSERNMVTIGSTMKGTGAAVIQRIERDPGRPNIAGSVFPLQATRRISDAGVKLMLHEDSYHQAIKNSITLQIEGAQGFSLSMYHGFYPYTTSRDVTPAQVMADCAIPWKIRPLIYGTLRTFPIRVANRFNEEGKQVGTSGPCYIDQEELDWSEIGVEPELTTVSKLPRRIFSFSQTQLHHAARMCGPDMLFLNFANYMADQDFHELAASIEWNTGVKITYTGHGPTAAHIKEQPRWF